jgi:hypothetical protein
VNPSRGGFYSLPSYEKIEEGERKKKRQEGKRKKTSKPK